MGWEKDTNTPIYISCDVLINFLYQTKSITTFRFLVQNQLTQINTDAYSDMSMMTLFISRCDGLVFNSNVLIEIEYACVYSLG